MELLNGVSIIVATAVFPASIYQYLRPAASTEHFITELRERRLRPEDVKRLARMHTAVLGDDTAAYLAKSGQISNDLARTYMLRMNPISEMQRIHPALAPICGGLSLGMWYVLGKKHGKWDMIYACLILSLMQIQSFKKNSGKVAGDMRYSKTFRAMKLDKRYGDNK